MTKYVTQLASRASGRARRIALRSKGSKTHARTSTQPRRFKLLPGTTWSFAARPTAQRSTPAGRRPHSSERTGRRRRGSRYFTVAVGVVAYAAILAFVLAADYITDYVDPLDLGPLVLSLFGIANTLLAFAVLQRYLARRIPLSRVRKRECPFCGYPVRGNRRCEGCGREVVASCAECGSDRRVGVLHCG